MADFLDLLARDARETINNGYYRVSTQISTPSISLKKAILKSKKIPIITEIKAASPSLGTIRKDFNPEEVAGTMENGGAVGEGGKTSNSYEGHNHKPYTTGNRLQNRRQRCSSDRSPF